MRAERWTRRPLAPLLASGAGAGVVAVVVQSAVVTPRRFRIRAEELSLAGWPGPLDGLRVLVIGDVHAGAPAMSVDRVSRVVTRARDLLPDLVLLVGDYVADVTGGREVTPAAIAAQLSRLRSVAPVVAVLGNHDWYAGGHRVRAALEAVGLAVLENQAIAVPLRERQVWVAGVADLWERQPDVVAALADVPDDAAVLLLSHNPDVVVDVPARVALTVSGHTHAGQFVVRGRPFHQVSPISGNRWLAGRYDVEGRALFVTSGLGNSVYPFRLGVTPEIVLLTLRSPAGG